MIFAKYMNAKLWRHVGLRWRGGSAAFVTWAPGSEPCFDRDLAMVADVFEVWRYIHEQHPIDTDLGFMQRLARAVEKALAAMTWCCGNAIWSVAMWTRAADPKRSAR